VSNLEIEELAFFTATLALAITFTLSCSSDDKDDGGNILADNNATFTDSRDSKSYKWVKIGDQIWMAENLNYNASGSKTTGQRLRWFAHPVGIC
jgi:hypothetical protein